MNGASKILIVEEEPQVRGIPSAPTSIAGAVGITQRGPIGEAVLCSSFEEFQSIFGSFTPDSDLALAAMGFFQEGGSQLWVVRTAHYGDVSDPASVTAKRASGVLVGLGAPSPAKFSFPMPPEGTFDFTDPQNLPQVGVDGGPLRDVTIVANQATLVGDSYGPFNLSDGDTLDVGVNGEPPVTIEFMSGDFADISAATTDEVVAVLNRDFRGAEFSNTGGAGGRVQIRSHRFGTSSQLEVSGSAVDKFGFDPTSHTAFGNVADLSRVTLEELVARINEVFSLEAPELASLENGALVLTSPTAGASSSVAILGAKGPETVYGEDSPELDIISVEARDAGSYGNRIEVETRAASNGNQEQFDLLVIEDGVYRESFANLTLGAAESVINGGSSLIRVRVEGDDAASPEIQTVQLDGGDDGLEELDDADFVGSETGKTGLHAFDTVQDLALLLVPGRATPAVHSAMIRYCEVARGGMVFAVLDPPANASATDIVKYVAETAALENASEYAAIYWPRVKVLNPQKSVFGSSATVVVPPSGIIAGVYARVDASKPGGVYEPPAGINEGRMTSVLGFETDEVLEEKKRDLVYPHRINPLTTGTGLPRFIDGSRTLKGGGNFPYIAERRGVIFIERSVKQGLEFARHRNNTEGLRAQVRRSVTAFLITQMNNGAFRSREPAKAFFVDVSDQLNPPSVVFDGKLIAKIGLATNKPAEFITLRISQDTRALEAELAGR